MARTFDDGVAIVAGGTGGLGEAVCRRLAASGVNVAFTYHRRAEAAEALSATLTGQGVAALAAQVDLVDGESVTGFADLVAARFGRVHSVVYAAGPHLPMKFISALTAAEWRTAIDTDVHGAFNLVSATLPYLRRQGGAMAAVITAAVERVPSRDICSAAPKAAIEMLFRGVALEEGRYGIRSNCVAPGFIDAGLGAELLQAPEMAAFADRMRKSLPMRSFGSADDVANAVVFLLSREAGYITGQSLAVDGGLQL